MAAAPDTQQQRDVDAAAAYAASDSFFSGWTEARRYTVQEVIGKGSYGVVCAAVDNFTHERVAIKKIQNVFDNVADATRILREIKLLRMLKHPDVVEIKHIMLPPDPRTYKDLYVVFELLESDLHTVIGANDDLTHDHHKVFLFQLLRGLNFIHTSRVLHRDLKPKNVLANSNCKLKICDFGLARPCLTNAPGAAVTPVHWTDYVATRWYRAPELCGCFYGRYSQAVDIWSIGCIFGEVLLGRPLFPGRDAVSQLQCITDLLGKPTPGTLERIGNAKARAFLAALPPKQARPFESKFPNASPAALALLRRLLAFDPAERPTAAQALADPYFANLPNATQQEPAGFGEEAFAFEHMKLDVADVRALIYEEALHYHPVVQAAYQAQGLPGMFVPLSMPGADADIRMQFKMAEAASGLAAAHAAAAAPAPVAVPVPAPAPAPAALPVAHMVPAGYAVHHPVQAMPVAAGVHPLPHRLPSEATVWSYKLAQQAQAAAAAGMVPMMPAAAVQQAQQVQQHKAAQAAQAQAAAVAAAAAQQYYAAAAAAQQQAAYQLAASSGVGGGGGMVGLTPEQAAVLMQCSGGAGVDPAALAKYLQQQQAAVHHGRQHRAV